MLDVKEESMYDYVHFPVMTFQFKDHLNSWLPDPVIC